jgi:L-arabinokinase
MTVSQWQGKAPGRLDVLGGVADYSGSLVLQMPICATTRMTITPCAAGNLELLSASEGWVNVPLPEAAILRGSDDGSDSLRAWLEAHQVPHWARYPLGCFLLFCGVMEWRPAGGLHFQIASEVPVSMGVSSSAALEVATLRALEAASGRRFKGTALARLAQRAENELVGAPCGLMDQLTATHGQPGALLPILCRPDLLCEPVPLPEGVAAVGWPSGVKHAVADSPYATGRTAAFMGKKLLESALGNRLDYAAELPPSLVQGTDEATLPATMLGRDFLSRYGKVDDVLSTVEPERSYPVRAAVRFPVEENYRAGLAVHLLRSLAPPHREEMLEAVGELLYQSHAGYSSIGLGCPQTDTMVNAIRERGIKAGFYGARVSGGGSGGTVVVLLEKRALPELKGLAGTLVFGRNGRAPLIA